MYRNAEGLHDEGRHEIGGDGRRGGHPKEEDEHRSHQRPPADSGQSDGEPDDGARDDESRVEVHLTTISLFSSEKVEY